MSNPKGGNRVFSIRIRPLWDHIQVTLGSLVVYGGNVGVTFGITFAPFFADGGDLGWPWGHFGVALG